MRRHSDNRTHLERDDAHLTHDRLRHGAASKLFLARALKRRVRRHALIPLRPPSPRDTPSTYRARHSIQLLRARPKNPTPRLWTTHETPQRGPAHAFGTPIMIRLAWRSSRNDLPPAQGRFGDVRRCILYLFRRYLYMWKAIIPLISRAFHSTFLFLPSRIFW